MKLSQWAIATILFVVSFSFHSCKEEDTLGGMEFKFTGLKDTINYLGSTVERPVTIYYLGGEREIVSLSVSGLPSGTSISFTPSTLESGQSATQKITSTATADTGNYVITVTGTTESGSAISRTFNLHVARPENTPPTITLTGLSNFPLVLNSPFVDPGFFAGDEEDGDLTAQVIVSGAVNKDSVGLYTISYVVTDNEGLKDSVVRTVNVKNNVNYLSGQYDVTTTNLVSGAIRNWITAFSASVSINNQFKIFKISDCYLADPILTYDPVKDSIFLPSQTFTCVTAIDSLPHTFSGAGIIIPGAVLKVKLDYTDTYTDTSLGTPVTLQLRDLYQLF